MTTTTPPSSDQGWTKEQLMGGPAPEPDKKNVKGRGVEANPLLWGVPGHLTSDEADVYLQFQAVVHNRVAADDTAFYDTIFGFGREEGEVWALCRFLRHAKFDLPKTIALVEEGQRVRATAAAANFYPNPTTALGCDPALYYHQFPQLYTGGFDKTGVPVFISKPGQVNSTAIQTLTDVTHIVQLHWYLMARDLAQRLVQRKAQYPNTRFECLCILDLQGLTTSHLNKKTLNIIKAQSAIDAVCFPETTSRMILVNAPLLFTAFWRLCKAFLDPRAASKVELISGKAASEARLRELVDADQLPSDYGGTGPDTVTLLQQQQSSSTDSTSTLDSNNNTPYINLDTQLLSVRHKASHSWTVPAQQRVELSLWTRSTQPISVQVLNGATVVVPALEIPAQSKPTNNTNEDDEDDDRPPPTHVVLNPTNDSPIVGPMHPLTIQLEIKGGGRFSAAHDVVLVAYYYDAK